jgi:hypothetical protein
MMSHQTRAARYPLPLLDSRPAAVARVTGESLTYGARYL